MIIILFLCLPTSYDLVDQLGSDSFAARRDATIQLIRLEDDALPALFAGLKSKDYEISYDCGKILDIYYNVRPSNNAIIPPIWSLNISDRFGSIDVAKQYYCQALRKGDLLEPYEWRDDKAEQLATKYYIYDRMLSGMTRQEAVNYLDQMVRNRGRFYYKNDTSTNMPGMPVTHGGVGLSRIDYDWQTYMFGP
jgi:hypothetical protein